MSTDSSSSAISKIESGFAYPKYAHAGLLLEVSSVVWSYVDHLETSVVKWTKPHEWGYNDQVLGHLTTCFP